MHVNYFDLGVWAGAEIGWMIDEIFPDLGITDYSVYGFEACKATLDSTLARFAGKDNVMLVHSAISGSEGQLKLYHARRGSKGHSIYSSKRNVVQKNFEWVDCTRLSVWIDQNVPSFDSSFNILRANIEGAELSLFQDLETSGKIGGFDLFCGSHPGLDMGKVQTLKKKRKILMKILSKNDIVVHRFCHNRKLVPKIKKVIRKRLQEFGG